MEADGSTLGQLEDTMIHYQLQSEDYCSPPGGIRWMYFYAHHIFCMGGKLKLEGGFQKFDASLSFKLTKRTRPPTSLSPERIDSCFVAVQLLFALNRRENRGKK